MTSVAVTDSCCDCSMIIILLSSLAFYTPGYYVALAWMSLSVAFFLVCSTALLSFTPWVVTLSCYAYVFYKSCSMCWCSRRHILYLDVKYFNTFRSMDKVSHPKCSKIKSIPELETRHLFLSVYAVAVTDSQWQAQELYSIQRWMCLTCSQKQQSSLYRRQFFWTPCIALLLLWCKLSYNLTNNRLRLQRSIHHRLFRIYFFVISMWLYSEV